MNKLNTQEEFKAFAAEQQNASWWRQPLAFGVARIEYGHGDKPLAAFIPVVNWEANYGSFAVLMAVAMEHGLSESAFQGHELVTPFTSAMITDAAGLFAPYWDDADNHANVNVIKQLTTLDAEEDLPRFKLVAIFADEECQTVETAYLKLIAMSEGYVTPRSINLDGVFGILHNVAWVGNKPYDLDYLRDNKARLQLSGEYPHIDYVDKFPRFLHHVLPADNTRILESSKVRIGAHLAAGTTVMPGASYINFNAGTLGPSMVEGRISSAATVGAGSDIGGGASILGVLSGGNTTPITVGDNCLLGVNSACGIPLGDGCIIDGGVTILAGSKVTIEPEQVVQLAKVNSDTLPEKSDNIYKAIELSGMNGLHFRQDNITGTLKAFRSNYEIKLNEDLH